MAASPQGYTGPYGNMFSYIVANGVNPAGMPAGANNQNAFILGTVAQYLTNPAMSRRGVAVYSSLSSGNVVPQTIQVRTNTPGAVLSPALAGPAPALFPNRNGKPGTTNTSPY